MNIRPIKESDFNQVNIMLPKMWLLHSSNTDLVSKEGVKRINPMKYLKNMIKNKNQKGFVAVTGRKIVGFIRCEIKKCPDFYKYRHEIYVDDLIVLEEYRNKGVATRLIE